MSKREYLFVLVFLFMKGWDIKPFGLMSNDVQLIASLLFMAYGFFHFKNKRFSFKATNLKCFWWIVAGILLSMVPAMLYHGQSIFQSVITYRMQLMWIVVPLLIKVAPSEDDIVKVSLICAYVMLAMAFLKRFLPQLFVIDYERMEALRIDTVGWFTIGFSLATIPVFYYLGRMQKRFKWQDLVPVSICMLFLFLVENRTTLFPMTILLVYSLLKIKSKYKGYIVLGLIALLVLAAFKTFDVWQELISQTFEELDDSDYNRSKAFVYFLSPLANPGFLTYILGNGFLSSHADSLMQDMMEQGVYNSDMGFLGFWNQFGILPVIVFLILIIKPWIRKNKMPYSYKLWSLLLLAGSLTISYFGNPTAMIYFALYYYMGSYYSRKGRKFRKHEERIVHNASLSSR